MAKYRFTFNSETTDPFVDSQYILSIDFVNTPSGGFQETVTFGDQASLDAAILSLKNLTEAYWINAYPYAIEWVSLNVTESTNAIQLEFIYEVNSEMFTGADIVTWKLGYIVSHFRILNTDGLDINNEIQTSSSEVIGVVDCTPIACDKCQEVVFSACQASYTIIAGLGSGTDYTVVLTDRNNVRYTQLITADTSGDLTIDTTDIPSSLFTPESGGFLVEVYEDAELTTKATITAGYYTYGCIQLSFQHTVTTTSSIPVQFNFLYTENDFVIDEYGNTFICN